MQDAARDSHPLQHIRHIALHVSDVRQAVNWYRRGLDIDVLYQDECWALLHLAEVNLALLLPDGQQPVRAAANRGRTHPGATDPAAAGGGSPLKTEDRRNAP